MLAQALGTGISWRMAAAGAQLLSLPPYVGISYVGTPEKAKFKNI